MEMFSNWSDHIANIFPVSQGFLKCDSPPFLPVRSQHVLGRKHNFNDCLLFNFIIAQISGKRNKVSLCVCGGGGGGVVTGHGFWHGMHSKGHAFYPM